MNHLSITVEKVTIGIVEQCDCNKILDMTNIYHNHSYSSFNCSVLSGLNFVYPRTSQLVEPSLFHP
jgi:hypothetical protein